MDKLQKNIWFLVILLIILVLILFIFLRDNDTNAKKVAKNIIYNNSLRISVGAEPLTLDPGYINAVWGARVIVNLFEGLTVRSSNGEIVPGVAKNWEVSSSGKVYTFYLREDAKWSDNTPVTADDFVFSIRRVLDPNTKSLNTSLFYIIEGAKDYHTGKTKASKVAVQAINKFTLKITLIAPASYFHELVSHSAFLPVPKHIVSKHGKEWYKPKNIISNGPYKVTLWKSQNYIDTVKNSYYWDKDNVKINKVRFYVLDDKAVLLKKYMANEIDIVTNLSGEICAWASKNLENQLKIFPFMATYYYLLNTTNNNLKNPKVRLALNMSVDRKFIIQKILKLPEESPLTHTLIPKNLPNYVSPEPYWVKWSMDKRIQESRRLLKEAGYDKNNPLVFSVSYNESEINRQVASAIAAMWKNIGVNAVLLMNSAFHHHNNILLGNYEVAKALWIADYTDPSTFILIFNEAKHNHLDFDHDAYNKEFLAAVHSKNISEAMQHYNNAENILLNSNAIIPLYNSVARVLIKPWVKGYEINHMDVHLVKYMTISQ